MSSCYDIIANDFSKTRAYTWKCVKNFIDNMTINDCSVDGQGIDDRVIEGRGQEGRVIEVGCGNGKNIDYLFKHGYSKDAIYSLDSCQLFVNMVKNKGYNCCLELAQNIDKLYPINHFNYLLCIAVIHHMDKEEERINTIIKCIQLLKKGGRALFTVWAFEQSYTDECGTLFTTSKPRTFIKAGDNIVSWNRNRNRNKDRNENSEDTTQINHKNKKAIADRYYYIYTYEEWSLLWKNVDTQLQLHGHNINIKIYYEEQNWITDVTYELTD